MRVALARTRLSGHSARVLSLLPSTPVHNVQTSGWCRQLSSSSEKNGSGWSLISGLRGRAEKAVSDVQSTLKESANAQAKRAREELSKRAENLHNESRATANRFTEAARRKAEETQKNSMISASKLTEAARRKAEEAKRDSMSTASRLADSARRRAEEAQRESIVSASKYSEAARAKASSTISEWSARAKSAGAQGAERLKNEARTSSDKAFSQAQQAVSTRVDNARKMPGQFMKRVDPMAKFRTLRNWVIGILLLLSIGYGIGKAMPYAITNYYLELDRRRQQQQDRVGSKRTNNEVMHGEGPRLERGENETS